MPVLPQRRFDFSKVPRKSIVSMPLWKMWWEHLDWLVQSPIKRQSFRWILAGEDRQSLVTPNPPLKIAIFPGIASGEMVLWQITRWISNQLNRLPQGPLRMLFRPPDFSHNEDLKKIGTVGSSHKYFVWNSVSCFTVNATLTHHQGLPSWTLLARNCSYSY